MADLEHGAAPDPIDLAATPEFDIGALRVIPAERAVEANGKRRELQPRVMQVLVALSQTRPKVVSRDALIARCWGGRVVSDDALNRCILALRHLALEFDPAPFSIETVPRIGHRLVERSTGPESQSDRAPVPRRCAAAAVLVALLIVAVAGLFLWQQRSESSSPISLAVLPFRSIAGADPAFTEGIAETLRNQLARQPQFRVAGSVSSGQLRAVSDPRSAARMLKVDYVVVGSVAANMDRVRVDSTLVRADDGSTAWSKSFEGSSAETFSIQRQIGAGIARALGRSLVRAADPMVPAVGTGEAYNLYLTARGLLRTRNLRVGRTAANVLRDAIRLDPSYAPAWASLAEATQLDAAAGGYEKMIAALPEALAHARHALKLQPDLADGHRILAQLLGHGSTEGQAHARRAVELDPNGAENWALLGVCHEDVGEFDRAMSDFRRAVELDPQSAISRYAVSTAETGNRRRAESAIKTTLSRDQMTQAIILGRVQLRFGDFSEAARMWTKIIESRSPRWSGPARYFMNQTRFALELPLEPLEPIPTPFYASRRWRIMTAAAPSEATWRMQNRNAIAAQVYREVNLVAAKLMLNAGRTRELAVMYDGPVGLLGFKPGEPVRIDQLGEAPVVALVLREAGRAAAADQVLREAEAGIRAVQRRGSVPFWFQADAAAVWAVQGRHDAALAMLEQAVARGWAHTGGTDLRRLAEEPAFRSLQAQPRFDRILGKMDAFYAREREETLRLLKSRS